MTIVYLARHGETLWNKLKKMQGWNDSPLTELGIEQAKLLSKRMENIHLDAIYSSPAGRAFKTAEIIKGARNIDIIPKDNFREISLGQWEGKDKDYLKDKYGDEYVNFWTRPDLYKSVDGESFFEIQNRVVSGLEKVVLENQNKTILIAAHAVAIKSIMIYYENRHISKLWEPPSISHTSLSRLDFHGDNVHIVMYGDDTHILDNKESISIPELYNS